IDHEVCIATRSVGRQRLRNCPRSDLPDLLVTEVREVDDSSRDRVGATAIFVNLRPSAEGSFSHILNFAMGIAMHDHIAPSLVGTLFDPVGILAIELDLTKANG